MLKGYCIEGWIVVLILMVFRYLLILLWGNVKMLLDLMFIVFDFVDVFEYFYFFKNVEFCKGLLIRWSIGISKLCR